MSAKRPINVGTLLDEREITETLSQYGRALDYGLEDEWIDCWMPDAIWYSEDMQKWEWSTSHKWEGLDEITALFRRHSHAPERYHKHLIYQPRIAVDGDEAQSECYFMRVDAHEAGPYIRTFGRYIDRLRRCPDGRWRFVERHTEVESRHPYSVGTVVR